MQIDQLKRWLKFLHFTPTLASWLNVAERFFAEIIRKYPPRGGLQEPREFKGAIIDTWKTMPTRNPSSGQSPHGRNFRKSRQRERKQR
jgi:hypothetical protein